MRLRKNIKRTAAAALALSMALSTATPAALAKEYNIADGSITITRKEDGKQEVKQNGTVVSEDDQNIIITGDNTVTTTSDDVQTENQQDDPDAAYSFSTMELTPEDYGEPETTGDKTGETGDAAEAAEDEKTGDATEESREPERTVEETEQGTVITYDDYDVDPDVQVTRPAEKPRNAQEEAAKDKDAKEDTITYDESNSNTSRTVTTTKNFLKIVNDIKDAILKVTLKDLHIDNSIGGSAGPAAVEIDGQGDVTLELDGESELTGSVQHAGIQKQDSGNLTIEDSNKDGGKLTAIGGSDSAGIGGSMNQKGQNITINSGTIIAKGQLTGAGIGGGGGSNGNGENITINGGDVTAIGSEFGSQGGAGIGGGSQGLGKNIKITGGIVKATGNLGGAGIGGGFYNSGTSDVTITGGNVTAVSENPLQGAFDGAGIGGGALGSGNVTISGKDTVVNAKSNALSAGIGGGYGGAGDVAISGGTVTAVGGSYTDTSGEKAGGAGIGSGYNSGTKSTIKISGGTVTAVAGKDSEAPGIGGSSNINKPTSEVVITGGKITAVGDGSSSSSETANKNNAAIGGKNTTVSISNADNDLEIRASIRNTTRKYWAIVSRDTTASSPSWITNVEQLFHFDEGHTALLQQFYKYDDAAKAGTLKESYHNAKYITENGLTTDNKISDTDPDKNAHRWVLDTEKGDNGTSTSGGTTTYYYKCELCNETKTATETTTPPAHDHQWGDLITDTPADCGNAGTGHRNCTVTGCTETKPETIPATGNHTWGDWTDDPSDSTKETRTCTVCGTTETRDKTVTPAPSPAPVPGEDNGGAGSGTENSTESSITTSLKVLDPANRDVIGDARYVTLTQVSNVLYIDADEDAASLEGTLLDLAELKADNIDTVVFSTRHCTSTIYTAEMAAQGSDDTAFVLAHSGSTATLTVGGVQHNELIH